MDLKSMKTISVLSGPGGVGKTTITVILAYAFTKKGFLTLLVDTDPSAGLSLLLLSDRELERLERDRKTLPDAIESSYSDVDAAQRIYDCIYKEVPFFDVKLDLIPSSPRLSEVLGKIWHERGASAEEPLQQMLSKLEGVKPDYDVLLIDSIPFYEVRYTRMACRASDYRVVVTTPRYLDVRRTSYMLRRMLDYSIVKRDEFRKSFRMLINKVPPSGRIRELVERKEWRELGLGAVIELGIQVLETTVPEREPFALSESPYEGRSRARIRREGEPDFLKQGWRLGGKEVKGREIVDKLTEEICGWTGLTR